MGTNSINSLVSSYIQSVSGTTKAATVSAPSTQTTSDSSQLSPFAQLMNTLQQLQQSNPTEYKQVTAQIATNLQTAAKSAAAQGNTSAATQLDQLATSFTNASTSGQALNVQDVAREVGKGGGGHHHHHAQTDSSTTDSTTNELDPVSIIGNTLANAA